MRSFKNHFKRVVGETILTFEELSTLATKIEACLNSRPLCSISLNGRDPLPLTPGHFLVGSELIARPEPPLELKLTSGFKSKWLQIRNMRDQFWKHWRSEVLDQLQKRNKWLYPKRNLQIDDLVIVRDDLLPPTRWPLARITATHLGRDGLVRVVDLKTEKSTFTRGVERLIYLPIEESDIDLCHTLIQINSD